MLNIVGEGVEEKVVRSVAIPSAFRLVSRKEEEERGEARGRSK
jgi:hypothetical protein